MLLPGSVSVNVQWDKSGIAGLEAGPLKRAVVRAIAIAAEALGVPACAARSPGRSACPLRGSIAGSGSAARAMALPMPWPTCNRSKLGQAIAAVSKRLTKAVALADDVPELVAELR